MYGPPAEPGTPGTVGLTGSVGGPTGAPFGPPIGWTPLKYLLDVVFGLLTYALLLRFAMQTLRAPFRNPVGQAVIALTDWIVRPLRKILPGFKGVDWASLLATILFQFLWLLSYGEPSFAFVNFRRVVAAATEIQRLSALWSFFRGVTRAAP